MHLDLNLVVCLAFEIEENIVFLLLSDFIIVFIAQTPPSLSI